MTAARGGLEPPTIRLTGGSSTFELPGIESAWLDLNQRSPGSEPGGLSRLSHTLNKSVQGDLNPRIHHGKVAGCRATSWTRSSGGWN